MRVVEGRVPFRGFETWYRDVGPEAGIPLLCLHGGPGSTHHYFKPLEELAEEDGESWSTTSSAAAAPTGPTTPTCGRSSCS